MQTNSLSLCQINYNHYNEQFDLFYPGPLSQYGVPQQTLFFTVQTCSNYLSDMKSEVKSLGRKFWLKVAMCLFLSLAIASLFFWPTIRTRSAMWGPIMVMSLSFLIILPFYLVIVRRWRVQYAEIVERTRVIISNFLARENDNQFARYGVRMEIDFENRGVNGVNGTLSHEPILYIFSLRSAITMNQEQMMTSTTGDQYQYDPMYPTVDHHDATSINYNPNYYQPMMNNENESYDPSVYREDTRLL